MLCEGYGVVAPLVDLTDEHLVAGLVGRMV